MTSNGPTADELAAAIMRHIEVARQPDLTIPTLIGGIALAGLAAELLYIFANLNGHSPPIHVRKWYLAYASALFTIGCSVCAMQLPIPHDYREWAGWSFAGASGALFAAYSLGFKASLRSTMQDRLTLVRLAAKADDIEARRLNGAHP